LVYAIGLRNIRAPFIDGWEGDGQCGVGRLLGNVNAKEEGGVLFCQALRPEMMIDDSITMVIPLTDENSHIDTG
jgi:hypothetical protein